MSKQHIFAQHMAVSSGFKVMRQLTSHLYSLRVVLPVMTYGTLWTCTLYVLH